MMDSTTSDFDFWFGVWQKVNVPAHLVTEAMGQHDCGWKVKPLLMELPAGHFVWWCVGCGACWKTSGE